VELNRRTLLGLAGAGAVAGATTLAAPTLAQAAVSNTVTKKGFGYGDKTAADVAKLQSLNLDWWYNWGQKRVLGTKDNLPEFVPMLYSDNPDRLLTFAADIKALKDESPRTVTAILGPNEPDWKDSAGAAKMTPLEVLNLWHYLQDNGFGLKKVSPANVSTRTLWQSQFQDAQKGLDQGKESWERDFEVNVVATHIYQQPHVGTWLTKVDELYAKYGKPVWVTETCVHDFSATATVPNRYSREEVNDFILGIWEGAASRPWLERIAWHTRVITDPVGTTGALFNTDGSLTSTGVLWASL